MCEAVLAFKDSKNVLHTSKEKCEAAEVQYKKEEAKRKEDSLKYEAQHILSPLVNEIKHRNARDYHYEVRHSSNYYEVSMLLELFGQHWRQVRDALNKLEPKEGCGKEVYEK